MYRIISAATKQAPPDFFRPRYSSTSVSFTGRNCSAKWLAVGPTRNDGFSWQNHGSAMLSHLTLQELIPKFGNPNPNVENHKSMTRYERSQASFLETPMQRWPNWMRCPRISAHCLTNVCIYRVYHHLCIAKAMRIRTTGNGAHTAPPRDPRQHRLSQAWWLWWFQGA